MLIDLRRFDLKIKWVMGQIVLLAYTINIQEKYSENYHGSAYNNRRKIGLCLNII